MAFVLRICRMLMEMALWHLRHGGKPSFSQLLSPARLVLRDDEKGLLGFKIRGRIVLCEMSILPDPHKSNVHGSREQRLAAALDDLPRILPLR
jgi:hypothetical protein